MKPGSLHVLLSNIQDDLSHTFDMTNYTMFEIKAAFQNGGNVSAFYVKRFTPVSFNVIMYNGFLFNSNYYGVMRLQVTRGSGGKTWSIQRTMINVGQSVPDNFYNIYAY